MPPRHIFHRFIPFHLLAQFSQENVIPSHEIESCVLGDGGAYRRTFCIAKYNYEYIFLADVLRVSTCQNNNNFENDETFPSATNLLYLLNTYSLYVRASVSCPYAFLNHFDRGSRRALTLIYIIRRLYRYLCLEIAATVNEKTLKSQINL